MSVKIARKTHLKPNLKMLCFAMAIISREEEKKKSLLPRLLYFTGFCTKAIQLPLKVYMYIVFLKTPLATVVHRNCKTFPLVSLALLFLGFRFQDAQYCISLFFFKGT